MDADDEDDRKPAAIPHAVKRANDLSAETSSKPEFKKVKIESTAVNSAHYIANDEQDDEVQIISSVTPEAARKPGNEASESEATDSISGSSTIGIHGDDDVQVIHSTGPVINADYPHFFENCCADESRGDDPKKFCPRCYCLVCDIFASQCNEWDTHYMAKYSDPKWLEERHKRRNENSGHIQEEVARPSWHYLRQQFSLKELLRVVTRVYPSEINPPENIFKTNLLHYQRQGVAFMQHIERNYDVKSGWLCSEVGMGKSAIVVALIATNPLPAEQQPTPEMCKRARFKNVENPNGFLDVKASVIFTTKSLMGQWEDEFKKHAPSLVVMRHFDTSKLKLADLATTDVIISSATREWTSAFTRHMRYRRVIVDESHLLGTISMRTSIIDQLVSDRTWCITATPLNKGISGLDRQIKLLELEEERGSMDARAFLEKYMLCHSKSMLIGGSRALTLPPSTTILRVVTMTTGEQSTFFHCVARNWNFSRKQKARRPLESSYHCAMGQIGNASSSKIRQLQADIRELVKETGNARSVILTHFQGHQSYAKRALEEIPGLTVYSFDGLAAADKRDLLIRQFQFHKEGPAAFIMTLKAGSVGITLTNATNLFLLEPCLHPAQEVQAAGRIHRMGQSKPVTVTKYIYKDTLESKVLELHQAIEQAGWDNLETFIDGDTFTGAAEEMLRLPPNSCQIKGCSEIAGEYCSNTSCEIHCKHVGMIHCRDKLLCRHQKCAEQYHWKCPGKMCVDCCQQICTHGEPQLHLAGNAERILPSKLECTSPGCTSSAAKACPSQMCGLCCPNNGTLSCRRHKVTR